MKSIISLIIIVMMCLDCFSQGICSGNLGENIFERGDFGSGVSMVLNTDPNIAPGYLYTTSVPPDGSYTVCSNTAALSGLYPTWIRTEDNSDDPNGYMMVVNASYEPGVFYEEEVDGLCENTLYEFSADILNLIKIGTPNHIDPNVSFLIDNTTVYSTGDIAKTEKWKQFGFSFVTNSFQTSITLTLRNNAPGGGGNDLALDNISFRPCGPSSFIGIENETTIFLCVDDDPLTIIADIETVEGQLFAIQWQSSLDAVIWQSIDGSINNTIIHTNFMPGDYFYRYYSAGNDINILNEKCRIISDEIKITILPDTYEIADTICEGLTYSFGDQQLTESGSYVEDFKSQRGCDSTVFLELIAIAPKDIDFDVDISDPSCVGFEDGIIEVNAISGGNGGLSYAVFDSNNGIIGASLPSGNYSIKAIDQYGCTEIFDLQLVDPFEINVSIGMDTAIRLGDELILNPEYSTNFASILWSGQGEFSCLDCEFPSFVPHFSGVVQVSVVDENGCTAEDFIEVKVDDQNFIILPNVFSPNDDKINDYLTINYYGKSVSKIISFIVYDRWGGVMHEVNETELESGGALWDGYRQRSKVDIGVYLYGLEVLLVNGVKIIRIGNVTVLN